MAEKFEVEGLAELEKKLLDLGAEMGFKTLRSAGREAMKPVLAAAQIGVNIDTGTALDSLALSTKKGKGKTAVNINVGATKKSVTDTASDGTKAKRKLVNVNQRIIAQEYGTSKQKAEPFLLPALEQNTRKVLSIFKTELAKKIDRAAKKAG